MPVYQYDGVHYDLPDGLTEEQALNKIKSHLGKSTSLADKIPGIQPEVQYKEPSLEDKSLGLGEAALSVASSVPALPIGFLQGIGDKIGNPDSNFEQNVAGRMDALTYTPKTQAGQDYTERVGKLFNDVGIPAMGILPALPGLHGEGLPLRAKGRFAVESVPDTIRGFPKGDVLVDAIGDKLTKKPVKQIGPDFDALDRALQAEAPKENSTEATPPVLYADERGVVTPELPDQSMELAKAKLEEQERQAKLNEFLGAKQGELFEPETNMHRDYTDQRIATKDGGERPLTRAEFETTLENLSKEEGTRFQKPEDVDAAYQDYLHSVSGKQGDMFDIPSRQDSFREALRQDHVPFEVEQHPFVKAIDEKVSRQEQVLFKLQEQVQMGKPFQAMLDRAERDLQQLEKAAAKTRANVEKGLRNNTKPIKFNFKKQGGGVLLDFGNKRERGAKYGMKWFLPDQRTNEEFLKQEANTKDIPASRLQSVSNYLTKGGVYQYLKTENPLIKRVVDRVLEATNRAKAEISDTVHSKLAKAAQDLNRKEKADVWAAQQLAEARKVPLTEEAMKAAGFNDRQIAWVKTHTEVMKDMYGKLQEAVKAAGMKPLSPEVAYLAARAAGDFRRLVYEKGTEKVVGVLGANTRGRLNRDIKKLQEMHPDKYTIGEERFFGGTGKKGGTAEAFNQMLEFIGENDPQVKELAKHVNDLLTQDAFDYMNAKKHNMARSKDRVFGMQGRDILKTAEENANDGMQAQINYAERIIEWHELSKAVEEVKPLLDAKNGLDMPLAKNWSEDYIQQALGNNPTELGRAIDNMFATFGKASGIGSHNLATLSSNIRRTVNGLLLGFINIGFQFANLVQPFKTNPEMMSFLKQRGITKDFDAGTGYRYLGKGMESILNQKFGKLSSLESDAFAYAKKNHVYSSDLFDTSNRATKGLGHVWDKATQIGSAAIEMRTRQMTFMSYVHLLHENGITKADGLFEAAQKLVDIQMNNYNRAESPKILAMFGGLGRNSYNLMSYKHNELNKMVLFAREVGKNKTLSPFLTHMASEVAYSGIMGMTLYSEANWLVEKISEAMGKPTSLNKMLLEAAKGSLGADIAKFGLGSLAGIDLTNRLGMGPLVSPHAADIVMPGSSKLLNAASAGKDAVLHPSEYNTKQFIREIMPASVSGALDRAWFSGKNGSDQELSMNRNKVTANAIRNQTDKNAKLLGLTGLNESQQKSLDYENHRINQAYGDMRKQILDDVSKALFTSGKIPDNLIAKYVKAEGDPSTLDKELTTMMEEQKLTPRQLEIMRDSASKSLTSMYKLLRATGNK